MKRNSKSDIPPLKEREVRGEVKDRFALLFSLGTVLGIWIGVATDNIAPVVSMGMIIGLISGLFTKIVSRN